MSHKRIQGLLCTLIVDAQPTHQVPKWLNKRLTKGELVHETHNSVRPGQLGSLSILYSQ